jgi:hypothetical protein
MSRSSASAEPAARADQRGRKIQLKTYARRSLAWRMVAVEVDPRDGRHDAVDQAIGLVAQRADRRQVLRDRTARVALLDLHDHRRPAAGDGLLRAGDHLALVAFHVDLDEPDIVEVQIVEPSGRDGHGAEFAIPDLPGAERRPLVRVAAAAARHHQHRVAGPIGKRHVMERDAPARGTGAKHGEELRVGFEGMDMGAATSHRFGPDPDIGADVERRPAARTQKRQQGEFAFAPAPFLPEPVAQGPPRGKNGPAHPLLECKGRAPSGTFRRRPIRKHADRSTSDPDFASGLSWREARFLDLGERLETGRATL